MLLKSESLNKLSYMIILDWPFLLNFNLPSHLITSPYIISFTAETINIWAESHSLTFFKASSKRSSYDQKYSPEAKFRQRLIIASTSSILSTIKDRKASTNWRRGKNKFLRISCELMRHWIVQIKSCTTLRMWYIWWGWTMAIWKCLRLARTSWRPLLLP